MAGYPNFPMIGVTFEERLKDNPPPYLQVENNAQGPLSSKWTHNPAELTVCMDDGADFPGSISCVQYIKSVEDLDVFAEGLLSRPLLMRATLTSGYQHKTKAKVFITVNTFHPVIKSQMLKALNKVRAHLNEGHPFAVEISFNSDVSDWFTYNDTRLFRQPFRGSGAALKITNSETFNASADGWKSQLLKDCLAISCCLFFCPRCCPFYRIFRDLKTSSETSSEKIHGEVKYVVWIDNVPFFRDRVEYIVSNNIVENHLFSQFIGNDTSFSVE